MLLTGSAATRFELERGKYSFVELGPCPGESCVEFEARHAAQCYPLQVFRLRVRGELTDLAVSMGDHGVVAPGTVVVAEHVTHEKRRSIDTGFFLCLALGGFDRILVRIKRTTWQCPGAAAMRPGRAKLKEDVWLVHVESDEQETGCTVEAPVTVPAGAIDPAVAVSKRHD